MNLTDADLDTLEVATAFALRAGFSFSTFQVERVDALLREVRDHRRLVRDMERVLATTPAPPPVYDPAASRDRGLCVDVRGNRCCLFVAGIDACARCESSPPRKP